MTGPAGRPADAEWVPLLVPDMPTPEELAPYLARMHAQRHYTNFGPLVQELEAAFARRFALPVEQLTTVANATQGLELALQALDLPPGSNVLVPAFTFVATATAVIRAGHRPVLCDVDAQSWMTTPAIARAACEQVRIDAAMPVATFGMPHAMQEWQRFEQDTGVPVIIDAAAAYGSQWLHGAQGTLVFSLHTTKSLPAGEGGLVVSTRPGLAARVRQLSNFGINLGTESGIPPGALASLGTNAKMSEYHAAIALISLSKWEHAAHIRRALQANLMHEFQAVSGGCLQWQQEAGGGPQMAPTLLCARLPSATARDALERACQQACIMTRRWYQPLLTQMRVLQPYCSWLATPHSEDLRRTLLGLPFFPDITPEHRARIGAVWRRAETSDVRV